MLERYTEKRTNGVYIVKVKYLLKNLEDGTNEQIEKLGKIEDIEEELGIDIDTFCNVLKNGIYAKDHWVVFQQYVIRHYNTDEYEFIVNWEDKCFDIVEEFNEEVIEQRAFFEDYGEEWALTKEELKDD